MNLSTLNPWILTLTTFLPALGAVLIAFLPRRDRDIRWFAMLISVITLLVSLHLPVHYREVAAAGSGSYAYEQNLPWITSPNIHYHIGIDGISLWLVVLTTFLVPFCVLASSPSISSSSTSSGRPR
jgi:NADH-quinone oxidoreductase subunit M